MEKDFVMVYSTTDNLLADMSHDLLCENNIKSVVLNKQDSMFKTFGEVEVYVHQNDLEKAREILKNLRS